MLLFGERAAMVGVAFGAGVGAGVGAELTELLPVPPQPVNRRSVYAKRRLEKTLIKISFGSEGEELSGISFLISKAAT